MVEITSEMNVPDNNKANNLKGRSRPLYFISPIIEAVRMTVRYINVRVKYGRFAVYLGSTASCGQ